LKVFLCTADASGDLHAAALVEALRARVRGLEVFGLGGENLVAAGLESIVPQAELAVAGLVEVLGSAPRILRAYRALRAQLVQRRPDLVVLVDSPDLNLPLAAVAKRGGARVLYYIAPQVWAWRAGRVRQLRERTDHVAVIFPFEEALLRAAGVRARFVGHPLVERMAGVRAKLEREPAAQALGLEPGWPVLGLLPGSRRNELAGNLPVYLDAAGRVRRAHPGLQVLLALAPTLEVRGLALPGWVRLVRSRAHEVMAASSCVLVAPGTATVEAALLGVPMLVAHRTHPLSFELVRRIARVPSSCMVNLIAGEGVVPERIQAQARPAALAAELGLLIGDAARRSSARAALERAVAHLGPPGCAQRVAQLALEVAGRAPADPERA
jgi:lipid-A-disaccharide synthase